MRARGTRILLALAIASAVAVGGLLLLAALLVLMGTGRPSPVALAAAVGGVSLFVAVAGSAMLGRLVARPVERILEAASTLSAAAPGRLPILGEGGLGLDRAAVAFERLAAELGEERSRLAAKVEELTAANRALAEARESLLRSEKLATVGGLAAGLAHEIGNPLGAIAGYAEVARSRLPQAADPELQEAIQRIAAAAGRIDRTVRDLLDFARPAPLTLRPVGLHAAVDAALRLARVQARFRGVDVDLDVPVELPLVLADEHHLAQLFLNLFLNSGDAMSGVGRVRVAARAEGPRVRVEVADTGPGFAPADLPRIFDPFFTTKDPGEGTGLGLAICHRIAETFGGSIEAANAPGGGAVVVLSLLAAGGAAANFGDRAPLV
ncbi:MAG TPA: ATP-binding protein [Anaeromyxobacteraceae bacterium]|nr:ATP-binding protein [Anaeromyxobacteraceae bacterium]